MSDLANATARLERATWDSRAIPRRDDIRTVLDALPKKPAELTRDQWVYKGWQISWDMPPIPSRDFDWCAQSPDFDAEYDDGVLTICGGQQVNAATYEDLLQEIEDAIEENAA